MSNRLRISLVIPAYNEESHLEECLQAALRQTEPFAEIIVVDNGSSDGTAAVAKGVRGVRLVSEPRRGIAYARNAGFDAASGDIIARIDADTVLPAGWAAHLRDFYDNPAHIDVAWTGGGEFVDVPWGALVSGTYRLMAFNVNKLLLGFPSLWGSNMAITAASWRRVARRACVDSDMHEDLDLALHLNRAGARIFYDKAMVVPAHLRRVRAARADLWEYLQWWPRTLRRHDCRRWRICWAIGVVPIYVAALVLKSGSRKVSYQKNPEQSSLLNS